MTGVQTCALPISVAGASVLPAYAAPSSDKLEDGGVYIFLCSADQTYALDVAGASTSNGAAVQLYHSNGTAAQKFTAIENDDNTWTFKNYRSSLVLDAAGGGKADRTIIQQYQSNGTDAQKWKLQENDDGTVTFIAKASGKALDVAGGHMADHTYVWLWHANGTKAQKYYMHRVTGTVELENNGIYKITSALSTDKTISIADGSTGNGANVQLNTYHGDASQQFITKENSDGTWTFINYKSGLAFDAQYGQTKSGTNIWQYTPNGTDAQKWILQDNGDGTGTFINARSGLAFDLLGGLANENQNVWLYNSNGTIAQKFNYEKVGTTPSSTADLEDGGVYTIKSAKDQNYGLDIAGASENDSANVQIYTLNGTPAQQFKAQKNDDGTWTFMNVNSGKVLDISGGNFNSGANVQQYASNGSAAQKWYAVANNDGSVTLRGSRSNVALDISGGQIKNDANVQIWSANDSDAQKFIFEKVRTITVDYDGNNIAASVVPESTSNTLYSKTTISTWIPVRDGFDFVGWNTQKDGQGTSYKPGEKAAFFDDITLYAQWVSFVSDYTITQYGTADGGQRMFYTIRSHSGKLIVVDGGYTSDASEVRDVIKENGGRVDAWILTHPHQEIGRAHV